FGNWSRRIAPYREPLAQAKGNRNQLRDLTFADSLLVYKQRGRAAGAVGCELNSHLHRARRQRIGRSDRVALEADPVVSVAQPVLLNIETESAEASSQREQHAFCATRRNLNVGGYAV